MQVMKAVIGKEDLIPKTGSSYPPPHNADLGRYQAWPISDAFRLTQFGAWLETLEPGAQSSIRHWHENSDELVHLISGRLVLIDNDGRHEMKSGDSAGFNAGNPNGHCLRNESSEPATFITIGTRIAADRCHYPDIDMVFVSDENGERFETRDGKLLSRR